jgi:hypothetical protein
MFLEDNLMFNICSPKYIFASINRLFSGTNCDVVIV